MAGEIGITKLLDGLGITGAAQGMSAPANDVVTQFIYSQAPTKNLDTGTLIQLNHRSIITPEQFDKFMRANGLSDDKISSLWKLSYTLLDAEGYIKLFKHGKIDDKTMRQYLDYLSFDPDTVDWILYLAEHDMTLDDILMFATQDIHNQDTVDRLLLDDERSDDYDKMCAEWGIPADQARDYWRSHWATIPRADMANMLYRGIIDESTYKDYLRLSGFPPAHREDMLTVTYTPLSRLDVRNMYSLSLVDEEYVYQNFLSQGYSPKDALLLRDYTCIHNAPETKGVSKDTVITAYKDSQITLEECITMLGDLGFTDPILTFWVQQAQYEKAKVKIDIYTNQLYDLYLQGGTALDEFRTSLYQLNLPQDQVNQLIDDALAKRESTRKLPDVSTLIRWLQEQVINQSQFKIRMMLLNYSQDDILFYLTEIGLKSDIHTRKYLSETQYIQMYVDGVIDQAGFSKILSEQGYNLTDINRVMLEAQIAASKPKTTTQSSNKSST